MITYGSICSGIEAASVAWHPLGLRAEWFAEIEPFPSAVLAYRWPEVSNLGDMTKLARQVLASSIAAPEVLVGGTPCQAFSVAGMRAGLDDPRGQLTIKYVELADAVDHVRPAGAECVIVWENVPGVLSDKGNAFGCFLGALVGESDALQPSGGKWTDAGCVYGPRRSAAWRVLDAQYFGLAQRRRRVFVVASARAGFDPAAVLFESEGVRRDHPPRRGQGQDLTGHAPFRPALQCGCGCTFDEQLGNYGCPNCEGDEGPAVSVIAGVPAFGGHSLGGSVEQAATLTAKDTRMDMESETFFVAPTIAGGARKAGGYSLDDIPLTAGTLTREAFSGGAGGRPEGAAAGHFIPVTAKPLTTKAGNADREDSMNLVVGTLLANGKAAGSATQQDAESGLLVVHGTQDPCVNDHIAHALGRNHGQENAVLAFSCKDYGADATTDLSPTLRAMGHGESHANAGGQVAVCVTGDITHTLKAEGFDASEDGTGRGQPIVADISPTLRAGNQRNNSNAATEAEMLVGGSSVRRLTPRECERLQGFPDDYTLIPYGRAIRPEKLDADFAKYLMRGGQMTFEQCLQAAADGPRYKAIGNSKAVPVVRWIGKRIQRELERAQ
ncbi:DNA cytosine methyltransferase [Ectopseudomonas oleovorans]|uniref:DNA (cytosine-5-)-methyltransferase n=1 Tax=Ectopseudomonas oleovorans TaxID=301 RepID=A0AA42TW28_ECTOL|nr:DNA cytosine methyltransferase [Pseudomonas oleovorans]MDH1341867.1 DNA cytosine methyltransferase [Pseudomonas oleovorans]MDH1490863.1 DNA cytosine methyltransferase [Pseudomonas oleovorans]WGG19634.1 DNA cytosine methyltransferase [Pseudomonas oleovorans]